MEHIPGPVSPLFEDLYLKDAVGGRAAGGSHYAVNGYAYHTSGIPPGVEPHPSTPVYPGSAANWTALSRKYGSLRTSKANASSRSTVSSALANGPRFTASGLPRGARKRGLPAYLAVIDEWRQVDPQAASDVALLDGMCALARADGETWWSPAMRLESMVSRVGTVMVMGMLR